MPETIAITRDEARLMLLHQQGLCAPPAAPARKAGVLAAIRRMGALQIDTIHVVARSPYLTLFSRLGCYEPRWLDELHAAGKLFEYWAHAACFLPHEAWPLYRGLIRHYCETGGSGLWMWPLKWIASHPEVVERVLSSIRDQGPLRSADFPAEKRGTSGWWNWKQEKEALEFLFFTGELTVIRREGFQRVYELTSRARPDWDDARAMPPAEARRDQVLQATLALGPATAQWLRDYFRLGLPSTREIVRALVAEGELLAAEIEGVKGPAYLHRGLLPLWRKARSGAIEPALTTLLSPFDPLVWDRRRCSALFGFDFQIECYMPEAKRRYGYFSLPVLHRGRLIGRLDPKAHRQYGVFEVKAFHLEPGVKLTASDIREVAAAILACAAWHGTPEVVIRQSDPPALAEKLKRACDSLLKERS